MHQCVHECVLFKQWQFLDQLSELTLCSALSHNQSHTTCSIPHILCAEYITWHDLPPPGPLSWDDLPVQLSHQVSWPAQVIQLRHWQQVDSQDHWWARYLPTCMRVGSLSFHEQLSNYILEIFFKAKFTFFFFSCVCIFWSTRQFYCVS